MKKWRKGILVLITICMVFQTPLTIFAHNRSEHNKELEAVLLGEGYSKYKTDKIKEIIFLIQNIILYINFCFFFFIFFYFLKKKIFFLFFFFLFLKNFKKK